MPIFAIIAGIGLAAKAVGTAISVGGARRQYRAQVGIEDQRSQQMTLDATRQRREAIRQMIIARSTGLSNAVNQGAQYGTGIQGGISQATSQTERNLQASGQNEQIGRNIFDLNKQAGRGQTQQYTGGALSSLGDALIQNASPISRIFGQPAP